MSLMLVIGAAAAQAVTPTLNFTPSSMWRLCTRESTIAQLKSRPLSIDSAPVIQRAFDDCKAQLTAASRIQSPEDIGRIQDEQRRLIQLDVEMFYFDNATGHI